MPRGAPPASEVGSKLSSHSAGSPLRTIVSPVDFSEGNTHLAGGVFQNQRRDATDGVPRLVSLIQGEDCRLRCPPRGRERKCPSTETARFTAKRRSLVALIRSRDCRAPGLSCAHGHPATGLSHRDPFRRPFRPGLASPVTNPDDLRPGRCPMGRRRHKPLRAAVEDGWFNGAPTVTRPRWRRN